MGLWMAFCLWYMHLLVPFLFHDLTSLHPPSFHRNDFSTCSTHFLMIWGRAPSVWCFVRARRGVRAARASFSACSPILTPSPSIPRFVTTYSPHYTSLLHLLNKHWSIVQNDPSLSTLFPAHPQLCYRRNPTLADSLVKASLPGSHRPAKGQVPPIPISRLGSRMVRCTDKRCKVCTWHPYILLHFIDS